LLGDPADLYSLTALRLRDACVFGVIDEEEIPQARRDDWAKQGYELHKFPRLDCTFVLEKRAGRRKRHESNRPLQLACGPLHNFLSKRRK